MQITAWKPAGTIEHSKTDVFLQRLQFTGELGERIKAALLIKNTDDALARLAEIGKEVMASRRRCPRSVPRCLAYISAIEKGRHTIEWSGSSRDFRKS
jgi:hypothetical protein